MAIRAHGGIMAVRWLIAEAIRAGLDLELRRTPGGMTRRQGHQRLFPGGREPIGGALRSRAVIREDTLENSERAVAPCI